VFGVWISVCGFWFFGFWVLGFWRVGCIGNMPKMWRYHRELRCYLSNCSGLDSRGDVHVCSLVPNPDGLCMVRRVGVRLHGIFDKHALRRGLWDGGLG